MNAWPPQASYPYGNFEEKFSQICFTHYLIFFHFRLPPNFRTKLMYMFRKTSLNRILDFELLINSYL
jgi:hypothetical protein